MRFNNTVFKFVKIFYLLQIFNISKTEEIISNEFYLRFRVRLYLEKKKKDVNNEFRIIYYSSQY